MNKMKVWSVKMRRILIDLRRLLGYMSVRMYIGLAAILFLVIIAIFADYIARWHPEELFPLLQAPSIEHLMGTDQMGRDVFSRVVYGARVSLMFGFGAAVISLIAGIIFGSISGYYGGLIDGFLSRFFDLFLVIPTLLLVIVVVGLFGTNIYFTMVCVGLTIWPPNAKIMRAQVLSFKSRQFVEAAVVIGASDSRVLVKHILPNAIHPVIANMTLQIGTAILTEACLSFLGLGDLNFPSWGQLLHYARYFPKGWWMSLFPGLATAITVFGFNLFGDGFSLLLDSSFHQ